MVEDALEKLIFQIKGVLPNPQEYYNLCSGSYVTYVIVPKSFKNLKIMVGLMKDIDFIQLNGTTLTVPDSKVFVVATSGSRDLLGLNVVGGVVNKDVNSDFLTTLETRLESRVRSSEGFIFY